MKSNKVYYLIPKEQFEAVIEKLDKLLAKETNEDLLSGWISELEAKQILREVGPGFTTGESQEI